MNIQYSLDGKKVNNPRIFFVNSGERVLQESVRLDKGIDYCKTHKVYALVIFCFFLLYMYLL